MSPSYMRWLATLCCVVSLLSINTTGQTIKTFGICNREYTYSVAEVSLPNCVLKNYNAYYPNAWGVYLNGNQLTSIPSVLTKYNKLLSLTLFSNLISSFPDNISFPLLEHLNIAQNPLTKFDPSPSQFPNLKILDISATGIRQIPSVISQFKQLETLSMVTAGLTSVNVTFPPTLRSLRLMFNDLTEIPPGVFALKKLENLQLNSNKIGPLTLTADQFIMLSNVYGLYMDKLPEPDSCPDGTMEALPYFQDWSDKEKSYVGVCVQGGKKALRNTDIESSNSNSMAI